MTERAELIQLQYFPQNPSFNTSFVCFSLFSEQMASEENSYFTEDEFTFKKTQLSDLKTQLTLQLKKLTEVRYHWHILLNTFPDYSLWLTILTNCTTLVVYLLCIWIIYLFWLLNWKTGFGENIVIVSALLVLSLSPNDMGIARIFCVHFGDNYWIHCDTGSVRNSWHRIWLVANTVTS